MKRVEFIQQRKDTWLRLQRAVDAVTDVRGGRPDESELLAIVRNYRRTIADLSLARSLFPGDPLINELNALVLKALLVVGSRPVSDRERFVLFFRERYVNVLRRLSRFFLLSCAVFIASAVFGYFTTIMNPFFANAIVGDEYTYMTIDNIEKGRPFAVYQSGFKYAMSSFIMANNIKVAFSAFAFGVFYGVGTFLILIFNGLMLGSVSAIFASHHLLFGFATTVMIHGTLELFAIMAAGAAGLRLGQSIFRPGLLPRKRALAEFGLEAFILTIAMVPVFVIAGVLEGYVTPLPLGAGARLSIIGAGVLFLAAYFGAPFVLFRIRGRKARPSLPGPQVRVSY
jgi:uncharacterized membrane protein SpoIIM required for sporulation